MSLSLETILADPTDSRGVAMYEALKHRRKYLTVTPNKVGRKKSKCFPKPLPTHKKTKLKPKIKRGK
jgi:hypothetical protein